MDARSLPRESIGSATIRWPCGYTGRCAGSAECTNKWYDHQPLSTAENGEVRITWDMTIYTDKVLKHNRPDITLMHKDTQKWTLIDRAVPADQEEKVEKYQELAFEIRRIHGASKVTVILIEIGALGGISKRSKAWLGKLGVPDFLGSV